MEYNFAAIEKKWQDRWLAEKTGHAVTGSDKPKFFGLIEFPYPSAQGPRPALHGHGRDLPEKADGGLQCPVPHRL